MNSAIAAQKATNITKTYLLMGTFLMLIIGLGYLAAQYTGNTAFLYGAVIFSLGTNIFAYWFSDSVAVRSAGAIPADEVQYAELHRSVERLSQIAGIPKPRVYIINDPAPNAFATGRGPNKALVAVTTGLMSMMNKDELDGVLAHELGHIVNRDILIMTISVVLVGIISVLANMAVHASAFGGNNQDRNNGLIGTVLVFASMILVPIAAQVLHMAISRKREFVADASAAEITGKPYALASALEKLGGYVNPMQRASTTTAHMFISNPFGSESHVAGHIAGLFSTHPPIHQRVDALRRM